MDLFKMGLQEAIPLILSGASGAVVKEILGDNRLQLPKICNGELFLGFIGSAIVGACVGYFVDTSPIMAFFAGYTGFSAFTALLSTTYPKPDTQPDITEPTPTPSPVSSPPISKPPEPTISEIIQKSCTKYGVSFKLAYAVAKCESGLNPKARNKNKTGSIDRGLYQINNYWHPNVSDAQADDPQFAADFFCKAVENGNLSWWSASKKCWGSAVDTIL